MAATKGTGKRALPVRPETELTPETAKTAELAAWLGEMRDRATAGDERANRELIAAYDTVPWLWERLTGLRAHAERSWLDVLASPVPGQAFIRRALALEMDRLRREVAGPDPSPLERLLADRVVLCWLTTHHADAQYAHKLDAGMSFRESEFHQRRCERAQRQLLRAIQTLATVRRLLAPVVQVNVAEQQIVVARP